MVIPALLTRISILPKSFITELARISAFLNFATSHLYPLIFISFSDKLDSISLASVTDLLYVNATLHPFETNFSTIDLPIPLEPPVIRAT